MDLPLKEVQVFTLNDCFGRLIDSWNYYNTSTTNWLKKIRLIENSIRRE